MKKRKSRADDKIETFLYSQAIAASYNTRKHHPNVSSKKVHSDTVAVSVYPLRKPPPQYRLDQYSSRPLVLFSDNLFCQLCHVIHALFWDKVKYVRYVFWVIQAFESESNNEGEEWFFSCQFSCLRKLRNQRMQKGVHKWWWQAEEVVIVF